MFSKYLTNLPKSKLKIFFDSFDVVFCDCDGVLINGHKVLNGADKAINFLQRIGKVVKFVSNNSSIERKSMIELFKKSNFENVDMNCIISPAVAIGLYFKQIGFSKKVHVIGQPALRNELKQFDVQIANDDLETIEDSSKLACIEQSLNNLDPQVGAVVICIEFNMTLLSLNRAIKYLQNPNVHFIITGDNKKFIWNSANGDPQSCLGPGYIQEIVMDVTTRKPKGFAKPFNEFASFLTSYMESNSYDPNRVLFIGDSLVQDIAFAKKIGNQQLLVLTGTTKLDDLKFCDANQLPDYYIKSMSELHTLISKVY